MIDIANRLTITDQPDRSWLTMPFVSYRAYQARYFYSVHILLVDYEILPEIYYKNKFHAKISSALKKITDNSESKKKAKITRLK